MSSGAPGFSGSSAADRVSQNLFKLIEFLGAAPRDRQGVKCGLQCSPVEQTSQHAERCSSSKDFVFPSSSKEEKG